MINDKEANLTGEDSSQAFMMYERWPRVSLRPASLCCDLQSVLLISKILGDVQSKPVAARERAAREGLLVKQVKRSKWTEINVEKQAWTMRGRGKGKKKKKRDLGAGAAVWGTVSEQMVLTPFFNQVTHLHSSSVALKELALKELAWNRSSSAFLPVVPL